MPVNDISLELIANALIVFEGLSLWKISQLAERYYPSSTIGTFHKTKKLLWDKFRSDDKLSFRRLFSLLSFYIGMSIKKFLDWLVWVLKSSPYIISVCFVFCVYLHALKWMPQEMSIWIREHFVLYSFIFIIGKLFINLASLLVNLLVCKSIQQTIPENNDLNDKLSRINDVAQN